MDNLSRNISNYSFEFVVCGDVFQAKESNIHVI